ncbi:glycosyltransferase family 2 protein [Sphingobacterium multivorum]|uniref:Hyaluronan synthase n=1 Tax=Sphingobacterium multivorum TaxID=28454 RepID=A0A2X2J4A6_SPHMU|nr:glycosyltransferase family A protein [Sphingobacterium multivorum]QRQ61206.1 glycosyltransferase family 2 protein [Sphingobacterium multivorum]SPZ88474.1 Hyaluronan synthase [Sphingobacterium multivorum]
MNPLISVIIPCYNVEKFVEEAVNSITNQTYKNLEIICIDDCSKDSTFTILRRLADADPRIKLYKNDVNLKLIKTLNKGIQLATGEFIARMDADDISGLKRFEYSLREFQRDPQLSIVSIMPGKISENGSILSPSKYFANTLHRSCQFMSLLATPLSHPCVMIKAAVYRHYLYLENEQFLHVEDGELWTRMLYGGEKVFVLSSTDQFFIRINSGSVSRLFSDKQFCNFLALSQNNIKKYLKLDIESTFLKLLTGSKDKFSFDVLRNSISCLKMMMKKFLDIYPSNEAEKKEIESWVQQRTLYLLGNVLFNSSIKTKLFIFFYALYNLNLFTNKKTWINIYARVKLNLYEKQV